MFNTLKGKISLIYFFLVTMIAVVGIVSASNLYSLSKAINGLMTDNYKSISAITYMLEAVERQDSAVLIYINVDREKGIDLFTENSTVFSKWYNVEFYNITEKGEKELVEKIDESYKNYIRLFAELQETRNKEGLQRSNEFYNNSIMPDFIKLKQSLRDLTAINEKAMFSRKDEATSSAKHLMYITMVISIAAVGSGFVLSWFFVNRLFKPIYVLTQMVKSVKEGDLNQQIQVDTHDEIGGLAMEFNNMTKRLQQYEQSTLGKLLEEKNKSLTIVKSISDPLIVLDTNYKIILLSNTCEKFFSLSEEQVLGKHFLEAIRNGELFDHIADTMNSKEDHGERIISYKSDDEIYFNVIVSKLKDVKGSVNGLIVVFQNVTGLKKLERVKTDFIATISHEFKTPLTSIIMGTSMILEESFGSLNEEQRSIISAMKEDELKLTNLVNEMLELSRIESDKAIFNIRKCSVLGIIENAVRSYQDQAQLKEVNLYYELEDDLPKVKADPDKITRVINNLIINALKYTEVGDEIRITAFEQNGMMSVSVKDTGIGIPPEYKDRIFDKFVQAKGQDIEARGTGLGLSIVKEIIEAHGGRIWCESEMDVGSEFIFTLPVVREEDH